ncbi:MAG: acetyl-CoA carboxylase biotin carboxylase subunit, partial [Vicinamibacteria bacterium]
LAESSYLAEVCEACHIKFIGPTPRAIRLMGDKSLARRTMSKAGVPVLPGSNGLLETVEQAGEMAKKLGYPVILKAAAGGGGRGMRIVENPDELARSFGAAQREAEAAFGAGDVYLEKYLKNPRHVEFQVLADSKGNVVHLGERECSIQRRHQKLLEESPSPAVSDRLRKRMGRVAVDAARAVGYVNAGTIEFLVDDNERFYFMEMNTRIQVEHAVTEMITGVDLVKEQIRVAAGQRLAFSQKEVVFRGASIECRINAEDPVTFQPSPGTIHTFNLPGGPGVRIDTAAHSECQVLPYYDSLIAKLVVHDSDRRSAIERMRRCLELTVIEGVKTTIPLHKKVLSDPDFQKGTYDTRFLDRFLAKQAARKN